MEFHEDQEWWLCQEFAPTSTNRLGEWQNLWTEATEAEASTHWHDETFFKGRRLRLLHVTTVSYVKRT